MRESSPLESIKIEVYPISDPPESFGNEPWQREVRAFRGEMIYDNGRLPQFRLENGEFSDADEHDCHAYHILGRLRSTGKLIASARLAPVELLSPSRVMAMDEAVAMRLLRSEGLRRSDVLEGARWIVDPRHRGRSIGKLLVVTGNVLARHLRRKMIWVGAITAAGQDATLRRFGFREASPEEHVLPGVGDLVRLLACRPEELLRHHPVLTAQITPIVTDALARVRLPGRPQGEDAPAGTFSPQGEDAPAGASGSQGGGVSKALTDNTSVFQE
ncbi:hypothetical protein GCM10010517_41280 [Streptosporangium fragile]|uniref:N-acetyltransferase domain-containing protein n=2 Tax=Streptosporangium fragile TaxID=46186 RepID=A0ABN3VZ91_9ACTN